MTHQKNSSPQQKILHELNHQYRTRRVKFSPFQIAEDRASMVAPGSSIADCITAETIEIPIMIAPCNGKLLRAYVNASIFPTSAGVATVQIKKAVIGAADIAMCTAIDIDNPTDETAIDGTLATTAGYLDFIEGQLIYAEIIATVSISVRSEGAIAGIEWVPTED
jgi:hypothetical protein